MKKVLLSFLLFSAVVSAEEKNEILEALNQAKLYGSELHAHSIKNEPVTLKDLKLDKKLYKALQRAQCRGYKYKYWSVNHSDGTSAIYGISQPKKGGVVIGRHLKLPLTEVSSKDDIEPSTNTCLEISEMKDHKNILFTTHILSFTPNLFHVYESINNNANIFVSTEVALWGVESGDVRLVKK